MGHYEAEAAKLRQDVIMKKHFEAEAARLRQVVKEREAELQRLLQENAAVNNQVDDEKEQPQPDKKPKSKVLLLVVCVSDYSGAKGMGDLDGTKVDRGSEQAVAAADEVDDA